MLRTVGFASLAWASVWCCPALAQIPGGGVGQSGSVTANDCAAWVGNGLIKDSGGACGGGGTPGGSNGQVQINNAGAFGGITNAQLTALINAATASLSGALPAWPNNTTTYFRGDGTYATLNVAAVAGAAPLASPTFTGTPAAPTAAAATNTTQLATTAFVTTAVANAVAGVNPAIAVQAATTQASDTSGLTYLNGASGVGATFTGSVNTAFTVDGFTFTALNQRVLIKNDTQSPSGAFNGIYFVTQLQTGLLPPILTRALDYDQPSDMNNTGAIPVVNGTVNALTSWLLSSAVNTVGTDPLTYSKFSNNPVGRILNSQSGNYTTTQSDCSTFTNVTTGAGNVTITLISAVTAGAGCVQIITKVDSGSQSITGVANNGSNLARITVNSATSMTTGQLVNVNLVVGTGGLNVNATWPITVIDTTHFDLQGSTFVGSYSSGGTVSGGQVRITDGATQRKWLSAQGDTVAFVSNGTSWSQAGANVAPWQQYFITTQVVTTPPGLANADFYLVSGGGGGGSGREGASSSARSGGGGGTGGGQFCAYVIPAVTIGASNTITPGAGGTGGTAIGSGSSSTNGNAGVGGGITTFGNLFQALGGPGGRAGQTGSSGASTAVNNNCGLSGGGGTSTASAASAAGSSGVTAGGGGGGGADATNTIVTAAAGGIGNTFGISGQTLINGGTAGVTAGASPGVPANIFDYTQQFGGPGGGGGAWTAGTTGQTGGQGGCPGGAGGGGNASDNTFASGAGGAGCGGAGLITWHFTKLIPANDNIKLDRAVA